MQELTIHHLRHRKSGTLLLIAYSIVFVSICFAQVDTLRVTSYNLLNFPDSTQIERTMYFRTVINAISADILIIQDISSQAGSDDFLNDVLNYYESGKYTAAPFVDGPDSDNELFYRPDKLTLVSNQQFSTSNRDVTEYVLSYHAITDAPQLRFYSAHLTMGSEPIYQQKRLAEATIIRSELDALSPDSYFFVCGSLNFYDSAESGFGILTENDIYANGQCFDPIAKLGNWHNNTDFADVHTHSSRTTSFGGGIGDGLNDRCDMILVSDNLLQGSFYSYLTDSYTTFGNDSEHFDLAVNESFNYSVADSVADALYFASNHLPVYLDFTITSEPTPVELSNFQAAIQQNDVILSWSTTSESNNYGFAIQRKTSDANWRKIGFQPGNGTSSNNNYYCFVDKNVKPGSYFYQLKQIDFDGQNSFSQSVNVTVASAKNYSLIQNYPNPFNASTMIRFQIPNQTRVKITVFDMLGKQLSVLTTDEYEPGSYELLFDASGLNSGLYFYKLEASNFVEVKKLMLIK